ncbi:hypothetical protein D3C79_703270 [compost metagenome]
MPASCSLPDQPALSQLVACCNIDLALIDSLTFRTGHRGLEVYASIFIEEQGWINASLFDWNRVGPRAFRSFGSHIEISDSAHIRRCHIKPTVMMADRRRIYAPGASRSGKRKLQLSREAVTNLAPMHQVFAVKDWNAGKIFKRACYQIVVFTHPTYARVWIKPGNNWIRVLHVSHTPPLTIRETNNSSIMQLPAPAAARVREE